MKASDLPFLKWAEKAKGQILVNESSDRELGTLIKVVESCNDVEYVFALKVYRSLSSYMEYYAINSNSISDAKRQAKQIVLKHYLDRNLEIISEIQKDVDALNACIEHIKYWAK